MGILDDYGIDPDSIKESSFDIEDGTYYFEVAEAEVQEGTQNRPDTTFFYIDYQLFDEEDEPVGSTRAWYTLAEDGDSDTKRVHQSMSFFKADLKRLGVSNLSDFDGSEIVGLKGVLQLVSTPGKGASKGKMYQNIRNIRLTEEAAPAPKKAPAKKSSISKEDAETKARVKANQAARASAQAEEIDDEGEDNPFVG